MAIVFNEYTIGGKVKEGVVVRGADDTLEVILRESLMPIDEVFLTKVSETVIEDNETPTLYEQLEVAVINGRPALELFASRIKLLADLTAKGARKAIESDVVTAISDIQADVVQLRADVDGLIETAAE